MTGAVIVLIAAHLMALPLHWALPRAAGRWVLPVATLAALVALSPLSALWLLGTTLATPALMRMGEAAGRRGLFTALGSGALVGLLLLLRDLPGYLWIGAAYFTLRHIHVLMDWWMGLMSRPTPGEYLRYQLFLPVLAAGPIHRFAPFTAQVDSRRWDPAAFFQGAERALFGALAVVVLGGWAMHRLGAILNRQISLLPEFGYHWAKSGLYWADLYFTFAGLTSVAVGLALMAGFRIEENFNRPWQATNLVVFWTRWHMTLSNWCRDYVFRPVAALMRAPAMGVVLSMLAMGLWHGSSAYWLLWGLWQGLGIVLTRAAQRLPLPHLPGQAVALGGPLIVLAWLTLSRPVIVALLGVEAP